MKTWTTLTASVLAFSLFAAAAFANPVTAANEAHDIGAITPASNHANAILWESRMPGASTAAGEDRTSVVASNSNGDWGFAATDRNENIYLFGPYSGKAECFKYRNKEAQKGKWVVVGGCAPQFPIDTYPNCKLGCRRSQ